MSFEIKQRAHEDVQILEIKGRLVAGEINEALRNSITSLSQSGQNRIVLEMSGVDYIDSSGLGSLVMCHTKLDREGGGLRLLNLTTRSLELLVLTKLSTVFELFDDEQNAINSFYPDRAIRKFDILSFVEAQKQKRKG